MIFIHTYNYCNQYSEENKQCSVDDGEFKWVVMFYQDKMFIMFLKKELLINRTDSNCTGSTDGLPIK